MRSAVCLVLLVVVGLVVAADPDGVTLICSREECTCQERDGLELVTCDCGDASDAQPLLVGDPSQAYVSERTRSLRVRRCGRVSLMSEALSNASRLTDLELSDIGRLELQPSCLYRAGDGPPRRLTVQRVADLRLDPEAFHRVAQLQQLELAEVVAESLPLDSFANDSDVQSFRLADSRTEDVRLKLDMADSVTVTNCTIDSLDVSVKDVVSVNINDNTMPALRQLRLNSLQSPHWTDTAVTIARNNITFLLSDGMRMVVDRLSFVNNTVGEWIAPLRVDYITAIVTRNDISRLSDSALREFVRVNAVDLRRLRPTTTDPAEFAFTFSENFVRASSHGQYDSILTPTESDSRGMALFRVNGNRFTCRCKEMKKLVKDGEEQLESAQKMVGNLFQLDQVYGQLYLTSYCLNDGRSLQQYREDAYFDDLRCVPSGASAAAAAGTLALLLVAAVAGLAV